MAGALAYEDQRSGGAFLVSFTRANVDLATETATLPGPGDATLSFDVGARNLSAIELLVSVSSSVPSLQPVEVLIQVTPPATSSAVEPVETSIPPGSSDVEERIVFEVFDAPGSGRTVRASSPDAAVAAAMPANATSAQGNWTALVRIAGGAPGPLAGTFTITLVATGTEIQGNATAEVPGGEQR